MGDLNWETQDMLVTELGCGPEKLKPGGPQALEGQQISHLFLSVPCSVLLTFCNRFSS